MKKALIILTILLFSAAKAYSQINVAFAIDNKYPVFTMIMMSSILDNNKSCENYTFYIIENNLSKRNKNKMAKFIKNRNQTIEFIHFDTKVIDRGDYLFGFSKRITPIAIARIFIPNLLPQNLDKVLYLDGDMLATTDIKPLYDTDLGKYTVGMCKNIIDVSYKSHTFKEGEYYNSGLILINPDKWRKENTTDKMIKYLNDNRKLFLYKKNSDTYMYPDQDLINIILENKILKLDNRWNNQVLREKIMSPECKDGIYHYIARVKPWNFSRNRSLPQDLYLKYWKASGLLPYCYYYAVTELKEHYIKSFTAKLNHYKRRKASN